MVYYRKYRPQTISELDSPGLRETLKAVLSSTSIPHAFLFTGPKGLGKTSTARIVAKVLNCTHTINHPEHNEGSPKDVHKQRDSHVANTPQNDKSIEPDNTCEQCVSITNGTNIDVLEIDGASNRGIDEIRELRERVKLAPSQAKKKVYIIDEVHMLTTEAFNALLKTIEEPPAHAVFIFCTTEVHKVPATILSRCFHVLFALATDEELVHALERIVKGENLHVEKEALQFIAHVAEGGFRDATKVLEEMVSLSNGKPITKTFVEEKLNVFGISNFASDMFDKLINRKTKEALLIVQEISQKGIDLRYFLTELLELFHEALLVKTGVIKDARYKMQDIKYSIGEIQILVTLFSDAYVQTKSAVIPMLPIEIAIIQYTAIVSDAILEGGESRPIESQQNDSIASSANQNSLQDEKFKSSGPTLDSLKKKQQTMKVRSILHPEERKVEEPKKTSQVNADQPDIASVPEDKRLALLENLLYKVKPINASIAGVLRGSKIKETTNTEVIFEANYKFHKEKLEEPKTTEILEKAIKEITGKQLKVVVKLKSN